MTEEQREMSEKCVRGLGISGTEPLVFQLEYRKYGVNWIITECLNICME